MTLATIKNAQKNPYIRGAEVVGGGFLAYRGATSLLDLRARSAASASLKDTAGRTGDPYDPSRAEAAPKVTKKEIATATLQLVVGIASLVLGLGGSLGRK